MVGHVAHTRKVLAIPDAYKDSRFNAEIDKQTGYKTTSILCVPVVDNKDRVLAVVQAINKRLPSAARRAARASNAGAQVTPGGGGDSQGGQLSPMDMIAPTPVATAATPSPASGAAHGGAPFREHSTGLQVASPARKDSRGGTSDADRSAPTALPFTKEDERLLAAVCSAAAEALQKAKLLSEH